MKEIKELVSFIRAGIAEADRYASEALKHKEQYPSLAQTYNRIARERMENVNDLHKESAELIEKARKHGEDAPAAMEAIWSFEHQMMVDDAAQVRIKLEMYKE